MKKALYITLLCMLSVQAQAETNIEVFGVDYGDSFRGKNFYLEHSFNGQDFLTLNVYRDPEMETKYFGLGRTFEGDWGLLQLSIGIGEAEYDDNTTFAYNPWLWYEKGSFAAYVEGEFFREDSEAYYYRGYVYDHLFENVITGVYAERGVGTGPMLGVEFEFDGFDLQLFAAKPVAATPGADIGTTDLVAYGTVSIGFNL